MEIRYGYGTTGTRVAGPVRVGDPLTLIIYMRSKYGKPLRDAQPRGVGVDARVPRAARRSALNLDRD